MKPSECEKEAEKKKETEKKQTLSLPLPPVTEISSNLAFIKPAASTLEHRFTRRVLRSLTSLRKKLDAKVLWDAVNHAYSAGMSPQVHLPYTLHTRSIRF